MEQAQAHRRPVGRKRWWLVAGRPARRRLGTDLGAATPRWARPRLAGRPPPRPAPGRRGPVGSPARTRPSGGRPGLPRARPRHLLRSDRRLGPDPVLPDPDRGRRVDLAVPAGLSPRPGGPHATSGRADRPGASLGQRNPRRPGELAAPPRPWSDQSPACRRWPRAPPTPPTRSAQRRRAWSCRAPTRRCSPGRSPWRPAGSSP